MTRYVESQVWSDILDSPEVRGAFMTADVAGMTSEESMQMAMIALFLQNKRLREGLITISKELDKGIDHINGRIKRVY